jgi:hypothetical protein
MSKQLKPNAEYNFMVGDDKEKTSVYLHTRMADALRYISDKTNKRWSASDVVSIAVERYISEMISEGDFSLDEFETWAGLRKLKK